MSYCLYRVPLHKTRTVRRLLSDSGLSLKELQALGIRTGAVDSAESPKLPVERLTNFMDVRTVTQYSTRNGGCSHFPLTEVDKTLPV